MLQQTQQQQILQQAQQQQLLSFVFNTLATTNPTLYGQQFFASVPYF
jgi:hypothetical protein